MAGKKRITGKQKSARRRNIKVAQQARKRGGGRKSAEYKAAFKKAYAQNKWYRQTKKGKRIKDKESRRMGTALSHLQAIKSVKTKAGKAKGKTVQKLMNKAYDRKGWTSTTHTRPKGATVGFTSTTRKLGIYPSKSTKHYFTLSGPKVRKRR